jgi:hypothetical protein
LEILRDNQNLIENYTPVQINVYAHGNSGFNYYGFDNKTRLLVNLYDSKNNSTYIVVNVPVGKIPVNNKTLIGTWSGNVYHNDIGDLYISVTASYSTTDSANYLPVDTNIFTGSIWLPNIARASDIACSNFNVGENAVITVGRKNEVFTHTISYEFGTLSNVILEKTNLTSIIWQHNEDDFYNEMPNVAVKQGKIICKTYNGNNLIGERECKFTVTVVDSPEILSYSIEDMNEITKELTNDISYVVKYASTPKITINALSAKGTNIKNYRFICGSIDITQDTNIFELSNIEVSSFSIIITDERGKNIVINDNFSFLDYIKLDFLNTETKFIRLSPTSTQVKLLLKGYYYNGSFGKVTNSLEVKYRFKEKNGNTWSSFENVLLDSLIVEEEMFNLSVNIDGVFDYLKSYEFELVISDKIKIVKLESNANMIVLTGERIMTKYKDRVDFKKLTIKNNQVLAFRLIDEWEEEN